MFDLWNNLKQLPVDETLCYGMGAFAGGLTATLILWIYGVEHYLDFATLLGLSCLVATAGDAKLANASQFVVILLLIAVYPEPSILPEHSSWWIVAIVVFVWVGAELGRAIATPAPFTRGHQTHESPDDSV